MSKIQNIFKNILENPNNCQSYKDLSNYYDKIGQKEFKESLDYLIKIKYESNSTDINH